ncbi:MAG: CBS domain-containing protein [Casimicrobiaceae bacterium]
MRDYQPLASISLAASGACALAQPAPNPVTLDSPALDVMTDLSKVAAVTIEPSAAVSAANEYMVARAVRSLFVTAPDGHLLGLVTTTDILGERPVRVIHDRGISRNELVVSDVMTPIDSIVAMRIEDVRAAKVGHIVASLKQAGRHHELVAEKIGGGRTCIRGIFSASQIARQLGVPLQITELARTFAEIEEALSVSR